MNKPQPSLHFATHNPAELRAAITARQMLAQVLRDVINSEPDVNARLIPNPRLRHGRAIGTCTELPFTSDLDAEERAKLDEWRSQ